MSRNFTLERPGHFIAEKRSKPYIWYGAESIAGKKCSGRQENLNKSRLVLILERFGV